MLFIVHRSAFNSVCKCDSLHFITFLLMNCVRPSPPIDVNPYRLYKKVQEPFNRLYKKNQEPSIKQMLSEQIYTIK